MKTTILLNFKTGIQKLDHKKYNVVSDSDSYLVVENITKGKTGIASVPYTMTLQKLADGTLRNENHVDFVVVTPDRRPKPFSVKYSSSDGKKMTRFATLAEAAQYVFERWMGTDYMDAGDAFHTDYAQYQVIGFKLSDIFEFQTLTKAVRKSF